MSTSREGHNPLRPYYKPPSIGVFEDSANTTSTGTHGLGPRNGSASSYASSARVMFSDMDYSEYLTDSSPSSLESIRRQADDWIYKYTSTLIAQPFDVAKTVLQISMQAPEDALVPKVEEKESQRFPYRSGIDSGFDNYHSDSDPDEPAYFTSAAPSATSYSPSRHRPRRDSDSLSSRSVAKSIPPPPHQLLLKSADSILEVISQEWTREGLWGVWKGSNSTFVYNVLLQVIENWSRGLLSALLNLPDSGIGAPGPAELVGAPYPWISLSVAVGAATMAGLILAPLDLLRTKLIITPITMPKRSLMAQFHMLQSYFCPATLIMPTIFHSVITPTLSHSTPLILRSHLGVDPVATPSSYQLANIMSKSLELFIKLPFETVLRRAQVAVLKDEIQSARIAGSWHADLEMTIVPGEYKGVMGTMWWIIREEGYRDVKPISTIKNKQSTKSRTQKGQGFSGLWKGWRVGMWGLVGMWTTRALNGGSVGNAGEF